MKTTSPTITKSFRHLLCLAGMAVAFLALPQAALAVDTATTAWNGGTTIWGTAGNWASGLPSSTNSALFDSTFSNQPTLDAAQTAQGIWLASGVGQNVTIDSGSAQILTITGTATLNGQTNAGIYMNDPGNRDLTIGPNTSILISSNTGFYNQQSSASTLTISGGLNLNNRTLTIGAGATSTGNVTIGGNITSATGGVLTINSAGTVTLNGSNSYKGTTTLAAGTLVAGSSTAFGTGALALTNGTLQASTDVVLTNSPVNLSAGTTVFSGANSITISGNSTGFIGGGNKTITNSLTGGKTLTFSGNLQLNVNATARQLTIAGAGNTTFSGNVSDNVAANGAFVVSSGGVTTFSGTNTFSGPVSVNNGATLKTGNANALGFGGTTRGGLNLGATTVSNGGVLDLNGTTGINEPIILNGTGIGGAGALINSSGSLASISTGIAGLTVAAVGSGSGYASAPAITIAGTGSNATATATLGLTTASINSITNGGSLWAVGNTLSVTGNSTNGLGAVATVTSVDGGGAITGLSITTAGVDFSSSTTALTFARLTGATNAVAPAVSFNTTNFTVGSLKMTAAGSGYTGTPTATWTGGGSATPALSSVTLATNSSIGGSGNITIDAVVAESGGARSLTKVGAGTVTLNGQNTFTGATTISGGTLVVNGALSTNSSVSVSNGATLAGLGTIRGNVSISGVLDPGTSSTNGAITVEGSLTVQTNGAANLTIDSLADYDRVAGAVTNTINGTINVAASGSYVPAAGNVFQLFNTAISGTPTLNLTPLADTNYVWVTNAFISTGQISVTNAAPPLTPYGSWLTNYPSLTGADTNGSADPDGDGFINYLEFTFDGNPTIGSPALLTAIKVGTNSVFNYVARKNPPGGVGYQVRFTGDLSSGWTNSSVTVTNSSNTNGINLPADYERKEFTVPASGNSFYRVDAVIAP